MEELRTAGTDDERQSIYRFRYRVFAQHLGRLDLDGLDHANRTLADPLDPSSRHFYYGEPGAPVASITFSPVAGVDVPRELSAFLDLERLGEAVDARRTGLVNWLLVDPAQSNATLVHSLLAAAYEQLLRDGFDLLLTFCRPGLVSFYEGIGLEQYTFASDLHGIGLRCPLMLVMRDGARLRALRSPLLRILLRNGGEERADQTRLALEPIVDMFQASQILVNDELWIESGITFVERPLPRLFDGIAEDGMRQIMRMASVISCRPGEVITREGETSDDMFLIVSGTFAATRSDHAGIRQLGQGDLFGELEHLSGRTRSENVVAETQGHVAALKAERLFQWMQRNPEAGVRVAVNLARLLAGRISS